MQHVIFSLVANGNVEKLEQILNQNPELINLRFPNIVKTPLLAYSASKGKLACMEMLLARGADVEVTDSALWTPLFYAAEAGHFHCLNLLLDKGADIERTDNLGRKALAISSEKGRIACACTLVKERARSFSINCPSDNGNFWERVFHKCTPMIKMSHIEVIQAVRTHKPDSIAYL